MTRTGVVGWLFLWQISMTPATVQGSELPVNEHPPVAYEIDKLPREAEKPSEGFWEFMRIRTKFGAGFEEHFNDNLRLQDNNKQEEWISTLEGEVFFNDPRGSLLYGLDYEVNARRYHHTNGNSIDHDFRAFLDFDPRSRTQYRLNYRMDVNNTLLFGPEQIDIIRRSADFQRQVKHQITGKLRYALNDTNALVPQVHYELFDDQAVNDADTDRREWQAILDADHDLKPGWTLFGGYEFDEVEIPGDRLKDSDAHSVRLGTRYELTDLSKLDLTFKLEERAFKSSKRNTDPGFEGRWKYQLGPRTLLDLRYTDQSLISYTAGRTRFRSRNPSLRVKYELTPLTTLNFSADYERQRSSGKDVVSGVSPTSVASSRYGLSAGIDWQLREKSHIIFEHRFQRSRTNDYTNHLWIFQFETEL